MNKRSLAVHKHASALWELTCHMGSHLTQVTFPPLPRPQSTHILLMIVFMLEHIISCQHRSGKLLLIYVTCVVVVTPGLSFTGPLWYFHGGGGAKMYNDVNANIYKSNLRDVPVEMRVTIVGSFSPIRQV